MQHQPALVTRDVRLSPVTLVVALPSAADGASAVPAYALEESCNAARAQNLDKRVSCGYLFMDSGDETAVTANNSLQVRNADQANTIDDGTMSMRIEAAFSRSYCRSLHQCSTPLPNVDPGCFC